MLQLLLIAGILLFLFASVLFLPGRLVASKFSPSPIWQLPLSLSFGAVLYAALLGGLLWAGFGAQAIAVVLRLAVLLSLLLWLRQRKKLASLRLPHPALFLWFLSYYLFAVLTAAYPDGNLWSASSETLRSMTALPIDNIIPYNVGRYIVEGIDPSSIDVVPGWSITSRGPLAGMLFAVFKLLLGVSESAPWLATTPTVFTVYHSLMVFLNLLVVLALWAICLSVSRPLIVPLGLLILSTSAFFYLNIIFTWPKFLAAFFLLTGFSLWFFGKRGGREALLCGVCLGASVLSHELALLYLPPFFLYVAYELLKRYRRGRQSSLGGMYARRILYRELFTPPLVFLVSFSAVLLPWQLYKTSLPDPEGARLLYMHLFCLGDDSVAGITFREALMRYLSENSSAEIIGARLRGLWFPFDVFHPGLSLKTIVSTPYQAAQRFAVISFFQLIYALGIPIFISAAIALFSPPSLILRRLALLCMAAVLVAGSVFPCSYSTVNHVWAYPAYTVLVILAAATVMKHPRVGVPLVALGVGLNAVLFFFTGWFGGYFAVLYTASGSFLLAQGCLIGTAVLALIAAAFGMEER